MAVWGGEGIPLDGNYRGKWITKIFKVKIPLKQWQ